jgi:hypothetical protein
MDRSVPLDRLPDGLTFPIEMKDRISYDEGQRKLSFRGFMSKADFDKLHRVHEDWGYRRALEELFRRCSLEPEPRPINRLASIFSRLVGGRVDS